MGRLIFACVLIACLPAGTVYAQYYAPGAPPVIPPPPLQPLPQVKPPEIAIPSAPVRPTPSTGFHEYQKVGPAPRAVQRRKGYGDRVVPCIQRGRTYGLDDRDMNAYVGSCAGAN